MSEWRKVLAVGDEVLALIASAAGAEHLVFRGDCSEAAEELRERATESSVVIVQKAVVEACAKLAMHLERLREEVLVVELGEPGERVDVSSYYSSLLARALGMRVKIT